MRVDDCAVAVLADWLRLLGIGSAGVADLGELELLQWESVFFLLL